MRNYLLELISKNRNKYIQNKPTLCLSCDRTGCRLHIDPNATNHPKPCGWLQAKAKLPKGAEYAAKIKEYTIALYKKCAEYALSKGIIIADTKFEFGLDENGNVVLGDEMLTPDSSRFWPLEGYEAGKSQPSFDKQFVRDWLKANPDNEGLLPEEIVTKTVDKYKEAFELLTGKKFTR